MRPKTRGSPTNVAAAAGPPKLYPSSLTRIHLAPFVSERKIPWIPLYVPQTKMDGYALAVVAAPTATVVTLVSLAMLPTKTRPLWKRSNSTKPRPGSEVFLIGKDVTRLHVWPWSSLSQSPFWRVAKKSSDGLNGFTANRSPSARPLPFDVRVVPTGAGNG